MIPPQAINQFTNRTRNTFTNPWGVMVPQQFPAVGEPLGVHGTPSFRKYPHKLFSDWYLTHESSEPVAGAAPYANGPGGYNQPPPPNHHWPAVHQQPQLQPQYAGSLYWNTPVAGSTMMSEASTFFPAPSTGKNITFLLSNLKELYTHLL